MRLDLFDPEEDVGLINGSDEAIHEIRYDTREDGLTTQLIGKKWLAVSVSGWEESVGTICIECGITGSSGVVGIWAPTSDYLSEEKENPPRTLDYMQMEGMGHVAHVETKNWNFGKSATITLHRSRSVDSEIHFKFLLLVRPIFDRSDSCRLKIKITEKGNHHNLLDDESQSYLDSLLLKKGEKENRDSIEIMKSEEKMLEQLGSFNNSGKGNIVHPKQHLTITGLKFIIDQYLPEKNDLVIGYIGTDTTENFCSFMRWLNDSDYSEKVAMINVFYTDEWDSEFIESLEENHQLKSNLKVRPYEINPGIIDMRKKCDIVISTYVAPWVGYDHSDLFVKLIKSIFHDSSYLLSVDPQSVENSVRSIISQSYINNQLLYKDIIGLMLSIPPKKKHNQSVEWVIYKNKQKISG